MSAIWTWTVHVGQVTDEEQEIYDIVLRSNQALIEAARAGLSRMILTEFRGRLLTMLDYGPYFSRRVGHGIGLDIHEIPYFGSQKSH